MAHIAQTHGAQTGIAAWFGNLMSTARTQMERRKVYRQTKSELDSLSNRELCDLGISRSMIRRLALEAAYGA